MLEKRAVTDGACSGSVGGWAFKMDGTVLSGWMPNTTNNQMELYAVFMALENCPSDAELKITTDSQLVIGWLSRGWALNVESIRVLVEVILEVARLKRVELAFQWVKGHAQHDDNLVVDRAAVMQTKYGWQQVGRANS